MYQVTRRLLRSGPHPVRSKCLGEHLGRSVARAILGLGPKMTVGFSVSEAEPWPIAR
jgi:hypothetical protein